MASQYGTLREVAKRGEVEQRVEHKVVDHTTAGMSLAYRRCHVCKVPMHRDGHETVHWCENARSCPHTNCSEPTTQLHYNLLKERK